MRSVPCLTELQYVSRSYGFASVCHGRTMRKQKKNMRRARKKHARNFNNVACKTQNKIIKIHHEYHLSYFSIPCAATVGIILVH